MPGSTAKFRWAARVLEKTYGTSRTTHLLQLMESNGTTRLGFAKRK